jgi:hypothetical protein
MRTDLCLAELGKQLDALLSVYSRCSLVKERHCVVNGSASRNKSLKPFRVLERAIDPRMEPSITKNSKPQVEEICFEY